MTKPHAKKALMIYKKSLWEIYVKDHQNARVKELLDAGDVTVANLKEAHEANEKAIRSVQKTLETAGWSVKLQYRSLGFHAKEADVVFSVGGDGTLLFAQRFVGYDIPVFGINSDPGHSVGALCACSWVDFKEMLEKWETPSRDKHLGYPEAKEVNRISVSVNGKVVSNRVLNDVLFAHKHPGGTSSYIMSVGEKDAEHQKSSGIWISTSTGSTGAIKSAGGIPKPFETKQTPLQYLVREPFVRPGQRYAYKQGFASSISLVPKMRESILAMDGIRNTHNCQMGDRITVSVSDEPLKLIKAL